ncbi:MAG: DUF4143 domain-containing protein [Longimicrobiales bacterium]
MPEGRAHTYLRRTIDEELDELLAGVSAIALEGPKGVGKTLTALQRARTVRRLDEEAQATLVAADPSLAVTGPCPILIDEWQRVPGSWDAVRRAVDEDPTPGRFLLTGSAQPSGPPTHSGAGRIIRLRMRPMSLAERRIEAPTVSMAALLRGDRPPIAGVTGISLRDYAEEIVRSGFPALRGVSGRALRAQMDSYVDRIVDKDFPELGFVARSPDNVRRWMRAYAAATATTATLETIRNAATSGMTDKPGRDSVLAYRSLLEKLWILDPVPAWLPSRNHIARLTQPDKHHLADPALAVSLLGTDIDALLSGDNTGIAIPRDGALLGHLFESLVTQSVRVYAQAAEAETRHLRTGNGRQEIDLIVQRRDARVMAIEVKLSGSIADRDVRHLKWLKEQIGEDLIESVVIHAGPAAYRRSDGIAVIPAALLGP